MLKLMDVDGKNYIVIYLKKKFFHYIILYINIGDGEISYNEFKRVMGAQFYRKYTNDEIKAAFRYPFFFFFFFRLLLCNIKRNKKKLFQKTLRQRQQRFHIDRRAEKRTVQNGPQLYETWHWSHDKSGWQRRKWHDFDWGVRQFA